MRLRSPGGSRGRGLSLCLALVLCALLTACGGKTPAGVDRFDAKVYVDGLLRETYLGEVSREYLDLVDITEKEAKASYEASMALEGESLLRFCGIEDPSGDLREEATALCREMCAQASFEVVSAAVQEDGTISVKVTVEPVDTLRLVREGWEEALAPFYAQYPEGTAGLAAEERAAMDQAYAGAVLELVRTVLPDTGHLAAEDILVELKPDKEGYYSLSDADFARLTQRVIDYPAS